jgi:hypothetical protein
MGAVSREEAHQSAGKVDADRTLVPAQRHIRERVETNSAGIVVGPRQRHRGCRQQTKSQRSPALAVAAINGKSAGTGDAVLAIFNLCCFDPTCFVPISDALYSGEL